MNKLKFAVLLAATVVGLGFAEGRQDRQGGAAAAAASSIKNQVKLKIVLPGDRPTDIDKVVAAAEAKMKDTVNVKLDLVFVPWADLAQKTQVMLFSGEPVDLIFDAPWNHIQEMDAQGFYEPLEELLKSYGPNVLSTRPQLMWDANKFGGRIIGVPLGDMFGGGNHYDVRKDIRLKLGFPEIKTYDDLLKFVYAVKQGVAEGKIAPISPLFHPGNSGSRDMAYASYRRVWDTETFIERTDALGQSLVLYYKNNDGKVYNLFDSMDPKVWGWIKEARKLYLDGILFKDLLAVQDNQEIGRTGKAAVIAGNDFGVASDIRTALVSNVPGGEYEGVSFFPTEPGKKVSNFKMWNFICIPSASKNKERAMMFLNWANSKEGYDLLAFGIEGDHWKQGPESDLYTDISQGRWRFFPYAWIWNPKLSRIDTTMNEPQAIKYIRLAKKAEHWIPSIIAGFSFDATPVQNEVAQYTAIENKYYSAIMNGVVDPDEYWAKFKGEAAPLAKKIQVELQKQIDAFLAAKKK